MRLHGTADQCRTEDPFYLMFLKKMSIPPKLAVLGFRIQFDLHRSTKITQKEILNIARDSMPLFYRQMEILWSQKAQQQQGKKISGIFSCVVGNAEKGPEEFLKVSLSVFSSHPSDHRVFPSIEFI